MIKNQISPVGIKKLNHQFPSLVPEHSREGVVWVFISWLSSRTLSVEVTPSCFKSHDPTPLQAERLVMPGAAEQSWVKDQTYNMDRTSPRNSSAVKNVGALAGSKMDVSQQGTFEAMKTSLSHRRPRDVISVLYSARYVTPGMTVWFWCPQLSKRDTEKLDRVQWRATRMIRELENFSHEEKF